MNSDELNSKNSNYITSEKFDGLASQAEGDPPARDLLEHRAGEEQEFEIANGLRIVMCWIPRGEFLMGAPPEENLCADEEVQHLVKIPHGFWLSKTLITQMQWSAVMLDNPSR